MKIFRQQNGLTLVEVLATILIFSIVSLLVLSIISNSRLHFSQQNDKNRDLQNIAYALKVLTKEIRQHPDDIVVGTNEITVGGVHYEKVDTNLLRNSQHFISGVKDFQVIESGNTISIFLESTNNEKFSTQIVKRN